MDEWPFWPFLRPWKKSTKAKNDLAHRFNLIFRTFSSAVSWAAPLSLKFSNRDSRHCLPFGKMVSLSGTTATTTSAINLQNDTSYLVQNQQRRVSGSVSMQPVDHPAALRLLLYSRSLSNLDGGKWTSSPPPCCRSLPVSQR